MIKKLYGLLMVFGLWYLAYGLLKTPAIPHPFGTLFFTFGNMSLLIPHLSVSMMRIFSATSVSLVIGCLIGIVMARNEKVDQLVSPIVYILYPIPKIAFLPILMLLFGLGETPKIILIISIIIFQFIVSTRDAVLSIKQEHFDSAKSLGIKGWDLYRHIIIPAILPDVFTALRVSVGVSMAVLFFGENFSTKFGIGYFIMNSYAMVNYQSMYAGIVSLSILGLGLFALIDFLQTKLCPWRE